MAVRSRRGAILVLALAAVVSLAACDLTDTDGDGIADFLEIQQGWDPAEPDEDDDGQLDGLQDSDVDGLTDWVEVGLGTDPDDRSDPDEGHDDDRDSLTDWTEGLVGTNAGNPDSDSDAWWDHEELLAGTDAGDALAHPRGFVDPPCDPEVESCPDVDLFLMWTTSDDSYVRCPTPICQPARTIDRSRYDRQHWHVTAELGPFHPNPDGSGFWPLESATITGQGTQADTTITDLACGNNRADTTWSQARPSSPPGPAVPFLTVGTSGYIQVAPGAAWATEVLRRDLTSQGCDPSVFASAWHPWTATTGPCTPGGFLGSGGVAFTNCTEEEFDTGNWPVSSSYGFYRVRGTFRPPS